MLSGIAADTGLSVIMINVNYEWGNISHFILIKIYDTYIAVVYRCYK